MRNTVIKNKIIALSGQPVSGKGSTTKALTQKLEEMGYDENNIHIIATGDKFRKYFNVLVDFVRNIYDPINSIALSETEEIRNLTNNPERRKILTDSIIKLKSKGIDLKNFSIEQANNLVELAEVREVIDNLIDEDIINKGKEINSKEQPDDIWIIDSRLAFHNVPDSFSVRLTTSPDIAAKRLLKDSTRGKEDSNYNSLEEAKENREKRRIGEQKRYLEIYGVDLEDPNNYDLIIDTSYASIDDTAETILKCLDYYVEGKYFAKNWTSPKKLLPLQREMDTLSRAEYTIDEMIEKIDSVGYLPNQPIDIIEVDGYQAIIEGHHRNFAAAYLGKTLVPYEVMAKDDETLPGYGGTARERLNGLNTRDVIAHEYFIKESKRNNDQQFSYNEVYPELYARLRSKEKEEETR